MSSLNSMPQTKLINIEGAQLTYLEYAGSGKPLVLLHATGFLPWLWHPIARSLSQRYRIFAPYFCDHRLADPQAGGMNWAVLAQDFAALCAQLNLQHPYLVGHSLGASVIMLAAASFGLKPAAMVLFEPIFMPEDKYVTPLSVDEHPLASKAIKRRNQWQDRDEARAYLRSRPLFAGWDEEMLELYLAHGFQPDGMGALSLTCSPAREAALFMGSRSVDPWPLLPSVSCPVLVVEGAKSEYRGFFDLQKAAGLMPRGRYHLLEDTGHLIPMERPDVATQLISTFFHEA